MTNAPSQPPAADTPQSSGPTRRNVMQSAAAMAAAGAVLARPAIVRAASESPVKVGFIEDESGNLSIYGIQKLHAAQLAVQEINDGLTLAGGPVGPGVLGTMGMYAPTRRC